MADRSLSLRIHPSEFPAAIRDAVVKGLKQGRVPGRLLYQSPAVLYVNPHFFSTL